MKWTDYLFTVLFVIILSGTFFILIPLHTEYHRARQEKRELRQELLQQELRAHQLRQELRALRNDPATVERIAREKLGWSREGETIYHFEYTEEEE